MMQTEQKHRFPEKPTDAFDPRQDLLVWLENNSRIYGDIYRATVLAKDVYVVSSPQYAQHVLRNNWTNYKKGRADNSWATA